MCIRDRFDQLMHKNDQYNDTVTFTHRPLHDPSGAQDAHDLGNEGEREWLIKALKQTNANTLLSGHIHIYDRSDFKGIDNIIVGQGLGHQDLLINGDHSKMALGQVNQDGVVNYTVAPLAMPLELHCHPRLDEVKKAVRNGDHPELIRSIDKQCTT